MPKVLYPIKNRPYPALMDLVQVVIQSEIDSESRVLEVGSGHSTVWLAKICDNVTSIEHEPIWATEVKRALKERGLSGNVEYIEVESGKQIPLAISELQDSVFDIVIIDCLDNQRLKALKESKTKVKPGKWIVIDDSYREMYNGRRKIMKLWKERTIHGKFRRLNGSVMYHETTFYKRPL